METTKPQSTTEELLPCPFCGSADPNLSNGYDEDANWVVVCRGCKSSGTFCVEKSKAIARWNTRTTNDLADKAVAEWFKTDFISALNPKLDRLLARLKSRPSSPASAAPVVDNLQRRLYEECITANWDPERKNTFAEEIAHLHEEMSEAFRAWRRYKDCEVREVNGKLEGVPIEFADVLIGMFYNAELYGFDLLAAVERKHQFNLTRNYVTEGRQLHAPAAATAAPVESLDRKMLHYFTPSEKPDSCFICERGVLEHRETPKHNEETR